MDSRLLFLVLSAILVGILALAVATPDLSGPESTELDQEHLAQYLSGGTSTTDLKEDRRYRPFDDDSDSDACTTHARLLRQACFADRKDDLLVHRADCVHVTLEEDERECRADARAEAAEKSEECAEVYEARLDLCDLVGEVPGTGFVW